jgi:hypothetical protein
MKIDVERKLTRKTMKEIVIYEWLKPKGFEISAVCIKDPVYKISLNLIHGSFAEFKRFMLIKFNKKLDHDDASAMVFTFPHEGIQWHFMNIQKCDWYAEDYGTIAHELHHFVHFALDEKGNKYNLDGEEAYAYIQGYFMELIVRAFSEFKKATGKNKKR